MNVVTLFGYMLTGGFLISLAFGGGDLVSGVRKSQVASTNREQAIGESRALLAAKTQQSGEVDLLLKDKGFSASIVNQLSPESTPLRSVKMRSSFAVGDRVTVGGERGQLVAVGTMVVSGASQLAIVGADGALLNPFDQSANFLPVLSPEQLTIANQTQRFRSDDYVSSPATGTAIKR